jgi:hypothetical protein
MAGIWEIVLGGLADALRPIVDAALAEDSDGEGLIELALEVGYDLSGLLTAQQAAAFAQDVSGIYADIESITLNPDGFAGQIPDLLGHIKDFTSKLDGLNAIAGANADLGRRLLDYVVVSYVEQQSPSLTALLEFLDLIHREPVVASGNVPAYETKEMRWENFPKLVKPADLFGTAYGWGQPALDSNLLLSRLSDLLWAFGLPASYAGGPSPGTDGTLVLQWMLDLGPVSLALGLDGVYVPAGADPPGIALIPAGTAPIDQTVSLDGGLQLEFKLIVGATAGYQLAVRPPGKVTLEATAGGGAISWTFGGELSLTAGGPSGPPALLFGTPGQTRLTAQSAGLTARGQAQPGQGTLGIEISATNAEIVVVPGDGDSFLQTVLPSSGLDGQFGFTLGWSTDRGVYFNGSTGLQTTIGVQRSIGPLHLESVTLTLDVSSQSELELSAGATASVTIGPVQADVDRVGVRSTLAPGPPPAIGVQFKPPNGLGLLVDAGVITGGGYIFLDPDKGQYAGVLELSAEALQIKVIGILNTILPGGQHGYSLLLIVSAEFEPIQLGFGFTLNGVGGLAGVNRTMVLDALRAGLKRHTLNSILFPQDPVANAPQIISDLESVFPPQQNRYVFGPMIEIGWGVPSLIIAELGVVLELPAPVRLAILGTMTAALPDPDAAVVLIHLDVLGTVDFEKKLLTIDATLYDSRVTVYTLLGDMALRMLWGANANFALAVGGTNPRYELPPGFPSLTRLTLSLGDGDNPRFSCDAYFAVTSNTVQFGAGVSLYAAAGGFSVDGNLGFDVLIVLSPFHFTADLDASVDLKQGGTSLMSVDLSVTLDGPNPWHATGSASAHILFFSLSVSFDFTWGDPTQVTLPAVDPTEQLIAAVNDTRSWVATLPPDAERCASLVAVSTTPGTVVLHPLGSIGVSEKVVPLGLHLARFGSAAPANVDEFDIGSVKVNGKSVPSSGYTPQTDNFAPAQFLDLTDDEKLSRPSFEPYTSGFTLNPGIVAGQAQVLDVEYQTILIDDLLLPSSPAGIHTLDESTFLAQARQGAAQFSPVRNTGSRKFTDPAAPDGTVTVGQVSYTVATTDTLAGRPDIAAAGSYGAVRQRLDSYLATNPGERGTLQIMPQHEVA